MAVPEDLRYTNDHEWVRVEDGIATVGVTEHAAEQLGDVVFVQLPDAGTAVRAGDELGEIESTKSVGELFSPLTGTIEEVNEAVVAGPELVNSDPYGAGWLVTVRVEELPELLDAAAYTALIGG